MKLWHTRIVRRQYGQSRVLRGGNWFNDERNARSANRNHNSPDNRNGNIGLRLAGALQQFNLTGWSTSLGSVNQLLDIFAKFPKCDKQQGAGCASKTEVDARMFESLPRCRLVRSHVIAKQ